MIELQLQDGTIRKVRNMAQEVTIREAIQIEHILADLKRSIKKKSKLVGEELQEYIALKTEQELDMMVKTILLLSDMNEEEVLRIDVDDVYEIIGVINFESTLDENSHVTEFEFPITGRPAYIKLLEELQGTSALNIAKTKRLKKKLKEDIVLWSIRPDVGNASFGFLIAGEQFKKRINEASNKGLTTLEMLPKILSIIAYRKGEERWYSDLGDEELSRREEIFHDIDLESAMGIGAFFLRTQNASLKLLKSLYSQETPRLVNQFLSKKSSIVKSGDGL